MANFELWLKGCEELNTKIYPLAGSGDTGLYKVWSEYQARNSYFNCPPVFQVWIAGKREVVTQNYIDAHAYYKSRMRERRKI